MVSTQAGDTTTAFTITTADSVYIDWAFINQGSVAINNAFGVELLLDGTQVNTWSAGVPLNPNFYTFTSAITAWANWRPAATPSPWWPTT